MITELHVQNYGCLGQVAATGLTPIHAFVGPNDSGKSTLLRAVRVLASFAAGNPQQAVRFDMQVSGASPERPISLACMAGTGAYRVFFDGGRPKDGALTPATLAPQAMEVRGRDWDQAPDRTNPIRAALLDEVGPARAIRLDADALRSPAVLLAPDQRVDFQNERGAGLAAVLDAIRDRGDNAFEAIRDAVRQLFREVDLLQLVRVGGNAKVVGVKLRDGTEVPASAMSDGLLFYIALTALPHLARTSVLLVEEPENGLHPARIAEVMMVLREISKRTQVLIATHSPLVINELEGHEVSVVTRSRQQGSKLVLLEDTPGYEERSRVYKNGELWLSYCDGTEESPLLTEPQEPSDPGPPVEWADEGAGEANA
ncbi:MAG: AAA family ATPase [Deltaproteobacteria bacterium]|nr:AAA family ATPase [Deltaproteobacteria bacterium]